ncbi:MAG: ABC transporter substrate-binding protein [Gemmatimonadetes bacterium]|nr:ABC transporter substrate-binding protein [Gemmatimonadota bacterium]NNK49610.1 ABC transporter substrate-binding protein [Gemmatimonadota bacterium]
MNTTELDRGDRRVIRVAHSPDSDDAFMFYGLASGEIDTAELAFEHELQGIQELNERAMAGELEVTAVSIHAYAYLTDRYILLPHGASMGEGYGPRLVSREFMDRDRIRASTIAIPGELTSAYLALKLWEPAARTIVMPFDEILEAVRDGRADVGLIIHEGQLTYADAGLVLLEDLGRWWKQETGLPLPLGGNVIRRDLGADLIPRVSDYLRRSIAFALDHREQAMDYAMGFARGLERETADDFVGMYVNQRTLDYGPDGRAAVKLFLERGVEAGILPEPVSVEFAD